MALQIQIVTWARYQYPKVFPFLVGIKNEMNCSQGMGNLYNRMGRKKGASDIFIAQPNNKYHGLWIEVKPDGFKHTKSNDEHVRCQLDFIETMKTNNYYGEMVIGFDQAKELIESYLNNNL